MSTAAISSTSLSQQLQQYFHTRQSDLRQLGQALKSGDLAGAQAAYNKIESLGQNGPFGGDPFKITQREQDFKTIGQALQSGDVAGAKQAFDALRDTFTNPPPVATGPSGVTGLNSSTGPEIILNLSNSSGSSPEQITININNPANGGAEQVSLSVGNQGANAPELTFNLNPNSNEQIVVNLLGAPASTSTGNSSGASASGGLSVSA